MKKFLGLSALALLVTGVASASTLATSSPATVTVNIADWATVSVGSVSPMSISNGNTTASGTANADIETNTALDATVSISPNGGDTQVNWTAWWDGTTPESSTKHIAGHGSYPVNGIDIEGDINGGDFTAAGSGNHTATLTVTLTK